MSSNLGQNQSQSSEQNPRRNRRHHENYPQNSGYYVNDQNNYYPHSVNEYNNGYNRYPQWSEPQSFGHSNGQSFEANGREFANYPQNYNNFNSNQTQTNYQMFRNNNESNKVSNNRRQPKPQRTYNNRNNSGNNGRNDYTFRSNIENQIKPNVDNNRNAEEVLQNPSNSYVNEMQTNKRETKEDNLTERQTNRKHRNDRHGRNGHQRRDEPNVEKKVERNETLSANNNNWSEKKGPEVSKRRAKPKEVPESDESQREIMEDLLRKGEFECMVCCDQIRVRDRVWSCEHCYNVFHIKCIKMWANSQSAKTESEGQNRCWRCPTCQTNLLKIPSVYYCFCGKYKEPELNRYLVPHSCGETCGRKRKSDPNLKHNCPHKCLLRCHPGSCPPCEMKVNRECGCGQTQITVNCTANDVDVVCNKICNKRLNCGKHLCERICHSDSCEVCPITKSQTCFCGQNQKEVECNVENNLIDNYCCGQKCNKSLKCGNHKCDQMCHFGDCNDCPLVPKSVTHCSCGKTPLSDLSRTKRQSCLDPIPNCRQTCDKELVCGPDKERHRCRTECHSGCCPACTQKTVIRCRCGANSDNIDCIQLIESQNKTFICKKRCNRKRVCGRHKCLNECCIDVEHRCQQICGKKLSCGLHSCEELCHSGNCPQCWNVSWDELSCQCGAEVKFPPIACGTKRPECERICSLPHPCNHPIDHRCHDDQECPPCTYFTPKVCFGGHEKRPVPCHETGFSCGYLCGKALDCGLHECQMICHFGECNECTLPCIKTREGCEHLCGLKCHQKTSPEVCPKSNCKIMVKVFCDCGRKTETMQCFKLNDENAIRISLNSLANQRLKRGESVDVTEVLKNLKEFKYIQLKCDDKCAVVERNRQLAEALDVKDADFNPDPGPPRYSDLLKNSTRTDPTFVKDIYES